MKLTEHEKTLLINELANQIRNRALADFEKDARFVLDQILINDEIPETVEYFDVPTHYQFSMVQLREALKKICNKSVSTPIQ